jgi:putative tryptophan/tyrosine transport system substrate-binding protein
VVVATGSTASALAAKAATETIPVVFQIGTDPVEVGLVASLNRPQGNVTGVTLLNRELAPKRLQLLHELVPKATVIAMLINPGNPSNSETQSRDYQLAAATLGLQLQILHASNEADFDAAFARLIELRVGALAIGGDAYFTSRSKELAALALHHAVPAIYQFRDFTAAGGLISYGGIGTELYRLVGAYTGRILKGERPADLPVIQSAKFELIVNLRTARILGITVPQTLLVAADEVFE